MIPESAALAIGKVLGQHLARAWLTGRSAEQERAGDLRDLVQARFPDRIVRRRFDRQIADIADQVGDRILSLAGHEYGGLRKTDKAAALAEAKRALADADLSDEALFEADMDPIRVAAKIRAALPGRQIESQLGEAGARLYDVVLDECCDCFVGIVRQLPPFGPRAATETLARLTGVADQVAQVLSRMPVRTLDAPQGTATDEEFRHRYLDHISKTLDTIELFGVRIERCRPRTTLSVAYVSLSVSAAADRPGHRPAQLDEWRKDEREPAAATVRVETALGSAPQTLIRGEAGSGKSTLLRWLAISAARGTFTADLAGWNGHIPFLIKLRSHTGRTLPPPERFLEGVADPIAGLMPSGWVHRRLLTGRALLLIDGVDELPGTERRAVRPWLAGLIAAYPGVHVVVTSRPAAARSDWLAAEGFATAFLERMTPADVKELIRHWHEAVRDSDDLPCGPEDLPGFEAALLARVESAPHLRALAASPLLAAMLCALNLDREKQLPRDRMGLYAAALELLLERRDTERQIPPEHDIVLERAQKTQILQDLAWRLSVTGRTELPKELAVRRTREKLAAMPSAPGDPGAVVEYLLLRSGVLREPVTGRIDFVHRTVQEYLTAKQFADDGDMEPLVANAHKDQWRETVIMAAGHANAPQRTELLTGLLGRIGAEPRHAHRLKLLVAGCLETLQSIPAGLRPDIEACVNDLVPPRDLAAARSLSNVGDQILALLPRTLDTLTEAKARAVVRTAWLVNGPDALDLLSGYGSDSRRTVQEELIKGWEYFDPEAYGRQVLADTPLEDLIVDIPSPRWLTGALYLRNLARLRLGPTGHTDMEFVRDLPELKELHLYGLDQVTDLSPLRAQTSLSALGVIGCSSLTDLRVLPIWARPLHYLSIWDCGGVADFTPLAELPELSYLDLENTTIRDLGPFSGLAELNTLWLRKCENVTDLTPLRGLRKLRHLYIAGVAPGIDLAPLADIPHVRVYIANGQEVRNPEALGRRLQVGSGGQAV